MFFFSSLLLCSLWSVLVRSFSFSCSSSSCSVSSCSINIEHTLTHTSYAQTSTIGDEIFLVFFVSSFFYFCLYIYIYIYIYIKKKKLLLCPSCFTSTVLFEHFIFNYRYGEEIIFYSFFTCIQSGYKSVDILS